VGFFDGRILCSRYDGELNRYDKHAIEVIRLAGTDKETILSDQYLTLFAAAVVWRSAAVSRRINQLSASRLVPTNCGSSR
jgi:hypothetical protein